MLALPPVPEGFSKEGIVYSKFALISGSFEPAGFNFDKLIRLIDVARNPLTSEPVLPSEEELNQEPIDMAKMNAKRRKKSITVMRGEDFYEVLNLDADRTQVTEDMIKKSYRRLSLLYHPDKHEEGAYDEVAKEQWLKVQEAYETLSDPEKRRRYDCSLQFNDAIPEKFDAEKNDFWEVFGPVFRRNAYFSKRQPVPQLGTPNDPIERVYAFYDFWDAFETWREFTHEDEYDLSQAEGRGERRWMEQENRRMKASLIKAEKARIAKFVNFAHENDPRIIAHKKRKEEEKEARKAEKKQQKEQQRQEEERRRNEIIKAEQERVEKIKEQERAEQEEKQRKIQRKKEAEQGLKESAKRCIKDSRCDDYYLDDVLFKLNEAEVQELTSVLNSDGLADFESMQNWVKEALRKRMESTATANQAKMETLAPKLEWTTQEISLLTKGVIKFPPGLAERWKRIALYIGGRFTEQECADKAKLMKTQHVKDLKKKEEAEAAEERALEQPVKEAPKEAPKEDKKEASDASLWSQEQQKALEAAIKKHPATIPAKERWELIASEVSGKTMKECVERFKYLKERLKSGK